MQNKNINDLRLSQLQKENNILSEFELLKEQNETNDTLENLKKEEDEYQTNLLIVLNNKNENLKIIEKDGNTKYDNDVKKMNDKYKKKKPLLITKAIPFSIIKEKKEEKIEEKTEPITQFNTPLKLEKLEKVVENDLEEENEAITEFNTPLKLEENVSKTDKIIDNYVFQEDNKGETINTTRREILKTISNNFGTDGRFIEENRGEIAMYLKSYGLTNIPLNFINESVILHYIHTALMKCEKLERFKLNS